MKLFKVEKLSCCWCLLVTFFTATDATESDVSCLKAIKNSLQDPLHKLSSSWNWSESNHYGQRFLCRFPGVQCWNDIEGKVLSLQLSNMGLKGEFPKGIENCTSITGLNFSNNQLQGPIPSDISKKLKFLTSLDLSSNKFSGQIPSGIADCSYLSVLDLSNNSLTGHIPQQIGLLGRIKKFSVANNMLSGEVPMFVNATILADSYTNNVGLCGGPLEICQEEDDAEKFDYSFKSGLVIGYVTSLISAIVVYASYCVPWFQMGKKNEMITVPELVMFMIKRNKNQPDFDQFNSFSTLEFLLENEVSNSEKFITRMSLKDLSRVTQYFSPNNVVGIGETGTTYKAVLPNGWSLAVKEFSNSQHSEEAFITELKILGRLRHNNIITLIGFCKNSRKRLLVYNYASNGNLSDWLHSEDFQKKNVLIWPLRMKIAVGLARGLAWLHHCYDFRVAHLSLSSRSVLLDQNMEPKLSNFEMATLVNLNEINSSSRGFVMDMEFWEQCFLKEDVLNFGFVLLELITGKKGTTSVNMGGGCFDTWIRGGEEDVIDELLGEEYEHEILECLKIAYKCVLPFPEQRPSMLDVYTRISIIRDRFGN
ncbi:Leucine-rich receptor-like protein kinase family protein [Euphorbia peplus]|nr:Leucine-rich receptor-like protein kinase family protein [Euphorbia peplus]